MRVVHLPRYDHIMDEVPDTDIFVGFSMRPEHSARAKAQMAALDDAGVGQLMLPSLRKSGIEVTNASGVHRVSDGRAHSRHSCRTLRADFPIASATNNSRIGRRRNVWNSLVRPRELRGQILLFIGFGAIGQEVAKIIRPLGMRVWAVTRSGRAERRHREQVFPASKLDEALASSRLCRPGCSRNS